MTEESEHYIDHPKVHKSPATLLDPESEGTHVACDLIGSRTRHTRQIYYKACAT
jgi:hypothetical protein